MRNRIELEQMPRFWPPKPSRFWDVVLGPLHRRTLRRFHGVAQVEIEGFARMSQIDPADGILVCPNHSYTGDGSVMLEFSRRAPRRVYIMAAWHAFRSKLGLMGAILQRMGAFSVDREGCDRRAIKQSTELLTTGKALCIFPEGEIYHLNERLTPLREGVAFIAASAQRELAKSGSKASVWLLPVAIRYHFIDSVMPALTHAMTQLEQRVLLTPKPDAPLHERIIRFGEVALTIKEKDYFGREGSGDLPTRLSNLSRHVLSRREQTHLGKTNDDDLIPVRVKLLRQHLLESIWESDPHPDRMTEVCQALSDVHLALQLYSYPGDYIAQQPTVERMAETIEKFEEDVYGTYAKPKGRRKATVRIGEPISVRDGMAEGKLRQITARLTERLEEGISRVMNSDDRTTA
jgi:1-acyl-sn-glycerol-3-phosphate acyltransferase